MHSLPSFISDDKETGLYRIDREVYNFDKVDGRPIIFFLSACQLSSLIQDSLPIDRRSVKQQATEYQKGALQKYQNNVSNSSESKGIFSFKMLRDLFHEFVR